MQTAVMTQEQELGKHVPPEIHAARLENLERQKVCGRMDNFSP